MYETSFLPLSTNDQGLAGGPILPLVKIYRRTLTPTIIIEEAVGGVLEDIGEFDLINTRCEYCNLEVRWE